MLQHTPKTHPLRAPWMAGLSALVLLFTTVGCGDDGDASKEEEQKFVEPTEEGNWILVDNIHSTFQNPDKKAFRGNYQYDGSHGYYRLFRHLAANGYPYSQIFYTDQDERLTLELLEGFKVLFINLLTRDRPDFTVSEIEAIHAYVRGGGGLFVIADHTNVYRHAERLNPLLGPMGVEVHYSTAADTPEFARGGYWLEIRHFDRSNPITEGVEFAAWQTGAPLVTNHGFAFTSPDGFGDFWNLGEESDPGYYGDGRYNSAGDAGLCAGVCANSSLKCSDDAMCGAGEPCINVCLSSGESCTADADCPGEYTNPNAGLPIMASTTFGEGRLAVVGDQNIFGDEWLFVGNNFELVSNIFEWVAQNENAEVPLRERLEDGDTVVGFELEKSLWNIAVGGCHHFFPFFINFNRTDNVAGRGIDTFSGKEDILVFPDPALTFSDTELGQIRGYLQDGKTVVLMADVTVSRAGSHQLIKEFIPDVRITGSGEAFGPDALPANDTMVETVVTDAPFAVSSDLFDVSGFRMSGHVYPAGVQCPYAIEDSQHYMRKLTVTGGVPLLQAEVEGETSDLARLFEVDGGRLIVFFQDGFWRNETLGWELQIPTASTADAHEVEYAFIDWLIAQTPGGQ